MENITEMLKGTLEGCVLEIISRSETYGYDITRRLQALGFNDVAEATVYTILIRLEKNKLISSKRLRSELGPPRKLYSLTETGQAELIAFWKRWHFISSKINELEETSKWLIYSE